MRAAAYIRVSSLSQVEGHSLDAQERLFRELCKNRGWEVIRVYREEGKSAHVDAIARRPVFRKLLDDSAKGEFDIVVVHSLDRWARNQRIMLESLGIMGKHNVSLVSITENIDYSNPQGKLFTQMLGSFAEYFSGALGAHVRKGLDQRAFEGKHTGGIPFGYESCWKEGEKGEKILICEKEHSCGVHPHTKEGKAVKELFVRYANGSTTLCQLASYLNENGFRTRNMHRLVGPDGSLTSGPRIFTTASVRGILHNPFYAGKVPHRGNLFAGAHESLISQELFDIVQTTLKKNSGRSETLQVRPERSYLLKGIIRCSYCGMPMWAQTYQNGHTYYREHQASRSLTPCPAHGGSITCEVADEQINKLVSNIELGPQWIEEVLAIISLKDEVERVKKQKVAIQEKLRRMTKAFIDGLFPDEEYHRQKKLIEMELESLVVPQADAAEEAGKLILNLPTLWNEANLEERRKLLLTMLDAVYFESKQLKSIVAIRPKPPFKPIFQVAATKAGSKIRIVNEPYQGSSVFLVETGESRTPPETSIPCFV
ncbi:MAG: recombinase family protein [Dehalococcoidales bacterium]|nr:recombinase family protein [Dehalococcoidales bacterium]